MKLKLTLEYDGTVPRLGSLPGQRTVEGVVRGALDEVFPGRDGLAVADGRTQASMRRARSRASMSRVALRPATPPRP